jgi:hypothetical protein
VTGSLRIALAAIVTVGAAVGLAVLSAAPFRAHPRADARLRVAFSARPERIETCRTLGADELANVPQHMRQAVVCEGIAASYRLEIRRDDSLVASALLHGGGLRHDRRLYALRELDVPSGPSTIDVRLTRVESVAGPATRESGRSGDARNERDEKEARDQKEARDEKEARDQKEARGERAERDHDDDGRGDRLARDEDEHRRRVADEVPSSLALREVVTLSPREVLLVTYDQASRRLRTVRGTP